MRSYRHEGSGATVSVDRYGHKTIEKHGEIFRSFQDLKRFEREARNSKSRANAYSLGVYKNDEEAVRRARLERLRVKGEG